MATYKSAQQVQDEEGFQYHVGVKPGDVAQRIMLVGDPARADKVASRFDSIRVRRQNREYVTITGPYLGHEVTVTATGIGTDNTEIAVIELSQCVEDATFLRVGSCGALQPGIELGDLVVSTGALRLEATSTYYVPEGYPAAAHHEVVLALLEAAKGVEDRRVHAGITATACGFYGPQGRKIPGFPPRYPDMPETLAGYGVKNLEMEASLLFTLCSLRGLRVGAVCAVYANRGADTFVDTSVKDRAEAACIDAGLAAFEVLRRMDAARGDAAHWTPSTGLGA
ncbi:MAG: nucleoside phosphorylase [Planctomycetota bacterium]